MTDRMTNSRDVRAQLMAAYDRRSRELAAYNNIAAQLAEGEAHLAKRVRWDTIVILALGLFATAIPCLLLAEDSSPQGVANACLFLFLGLAPLMVLDSALADAQRSYRRKLTHLRVRLAQAEARWSNDQ